MTEYAKFVIKLVFKLHFMRDIQKSTIIPNEMTRVPPTALKIATDYDFPRKFTNIKIHFNSNE